MKLKEIISTTALSKPNDMDKFNFKDEKAAYKYIESVLTECSKVPIIYKGFFYR